jgi:hypothetical protein
MAITYDRDNTVRLNNLRSDGELTQILDGVTATGYSSNVEAPSYAAVKVVIRASSVTSGATFKFWSSSQLEEPDFTSAVADDNLIALTNVVPTAAPSGADSSSAVSSVTIDEDGVFEFEFNHNYARWYNVELDARTDGTYSVWMIGANI